MSRKIFAPSEAKYAFCLRQKRFAAFGGEILY
jgi:hypothetical protein